MPNMNKSNMNWENYIYTHRIPEIEMNKIKEINRILGVCSTNAAIRLKAAPPCRRDLHGEITLQLVRSVHSGLSQPGRQGKSLRTRLIPSSCNSVTTTFSSTSAALLQPSLVVHFPFLSVTLRPIKWYYVERLAAERKCITGNIA